jgi:hypothetical protein
MSNRILLSKTAKALMKATPLTDGLCNVVGQYLGTDIKFYQVGDLYVEATNRIRLRQGGDRYPVANKQLVLLLNPGEDIGTARWFQGRRFYVYEVERRTASRLRAKLLRTITAYTKWIKQFDAIDETFDANKIAGLFQKTYPNRVGQTFMPITDAVDELKALTENYEVRDATGKELRYDVDGNDPRGKWHGTLVLFNQLTAKSDNSE